jgi:membrane protease YdiL (CAAX protease family)
MVIAPLFEETFFRGFLFPGFARSWGLLLGAIASAAVFAFSHQQLDIFVPLFALGLALAWVYHVSRSIWGSIALHSIWNGLAVIAWLAGA